MERRLTKKVQQHNDDLKEGIMSWLTDNGLTISEVSTNTNKIEEFKTFMGNYADIMFTKEDFLKRKRVKNVAPQCERCGAKRANGTQCTRRKKEAGKYCGTHSKGTPHGEISPSDGDVATVKKVEVWTEDFKGINYYIDSANNVYKTQDIMENKQNPAIIAKWELVGGKYEIPSLGV
jgi:hypothetical protein